MHIVIATGAVIIITLTVVALVAAPFLAGRAALAIEAVIRRVRDALSDVSETTVLVVVLTPMGTVATTLRRGQRSARSCHLSVRDHRRQDFLCSQRGKRARRRGSEASLLKYTWR